MSIYQLGSKGPEVLRIQKELKARELYLGDLDGIFGGGSEGAVKRFQKSLGQEATGIVDSKTWQALFDGAMPPEPAICKETLAYRCLALTGSIETGMPIPDCFAGISGDFDGQGLSFGALQWNLGQGSLQPLFMEMAQRHPDLLEDVFQNLYPKFKKILSSSKKDQLIWVRSIQDPQRFVLDEPWQGIFKTLGRLKEFQNIEVRHAGNLFYEAQKLREEYGLWSQRAQALMFDIKVQNGSISAPVKKQIMTDFKQLSTALKQDKLEEQQLIIIAKRRAQASDPRWVEDVRKRKLVIALGAGHIHGNYYHLEDQYGIRLEPI